MKDDCKITCNGKDIATIKSGKGEFSIKWTEEGKKLCGENCNCGC